MGEGLNDYAGIKFNAYACPSIYNTLQLA